MIQLKSVEFSYGHQDIFDFLDFEIKQGERVLIQGPSGTGKSTLLQILAGILQPQKGSICIAGTEISKLSSSGRDRFRKDVYGFVFQQFNLLSYLTIEENIALALGFSKIKKEKVINQFGSIEKAVSDYIRLLDLETLRSKTPKVLSQGQKQRVAIARACIGNPPILLADEPTSSLDLENTDQSMKLLINQCQQHNTSLILVSHDERIKPYFDRILSLEEMIQ